MRDDRQENVGAPDTVKGPGPCEAPEISRRGRKAPCEEKHDDHDHEGHDHEGHGAGLFARHSHVDPRATDRKRLLGTLVLTSSMMVAEAVGGWLSGSLSLLSDAGHMLTDTAALALALLALWFASRPADLKRTFGFFRLEILSALLNGLALIAIAGVIAVEAWQRIAHPQPITAPLMLGIAAAGLLVNLGGLALLARSHSMNVRGAFLHVAGDALSSIGVLIAGAIIWLTDWTLIDPVLSVVIALVITVGAVSLVRDAVHVLLEAVPGHIDLSEVFGALKEVDGVREIHDLHVWTISSHMHALSAHVVVSDESAGRADEVLTRPRELLLERFGLDHSTLQIESETFARRSEHPH